MASIVYLGVYLGVIAVVLLLLQPFPVLHDYPEWMYQGHIVYSLITGASRYADMYELVNNPVPNALSQAGIALLNHVVSPVVAGKFWLAVYLLLAALTGILVGRKCHAVVQVLFIFCIALGSGFWNGYINFQFGLLFFTLFVLSNKATHSVWRILAFSVVIYFSHASVFAAFVIYVAACSFVPERRVTALLALVPTLVLLLWYSVVRVLADSSYNTSVGSLMQWLQYKIYTMAKQGPFHNFILADGQSFLGDVNYLYVTGFVLNFIVVVLIGVWMLFVAWRFIRHQLATKKSKPDHAAHVDKETPVHSSVLITVIILLVLWLIAGKNSFGVVNLGERFLVLALLLLLVKTEYPKWIASIWAVLCIGVGFLTLGSLLLLSQSTESYAVQHNAADTELEKYVEDIYRNSRHKYFNHRLFIYADLGHYLRDVDQFDIPPPFDHESSIVRTRATKNKTLKKHSENN